MLENARQVRDRSGPYYDRWVRGTFDSVTAMARELAKREPSA